MKNWKTTLAGILAAAGTAAITYFQTGGVDLKTAGYMAAFAGLGYLAKDAGVTGVSK
jgi:hypothetical protein